MSGRKPGDGTCDVCKADDVLTSVCETTGKAYCRGVYSCKKGAGVNVAGTGAHGKRRKTGQESGGGREHGVGGGGGRWVVGSTDIGGDSGVEPMRLVKIRQIIGFQLVGELPAHDVARREALTPDKYDVELRVRGWFAASASDMGVADTRWVKLNECAANADANFVPLANGLVESISATMNAALGLAAAPAPAAAAATAATAAAETVEVAAPAQADDEDAAAEETFDGAGVAAAAAVTTVGQHNALVRAMAAYLEAKQCTLTSVYSLFARAHKVAPSEFSIWLGRTGGRIIAPQKASIRAYSKIFQDRSEISRIPRISVSPSHIYAVGNGSYALHCVRHEVKSTSVTSRTSLRLSALAHRTTVARHGSHGVRSYLGAFHSFLLLSPSFGGFL